jgi:hypothetical protein
MISSPRLPCFQSNLPLFILLAVFLGVSNARPSNLSWLEVNPNVRSEALGGCGVALDDGADATALNPAGLGWLQGSDLFLMHNQWFDDTNLEHFAFGMPLANQFGAGILLDYANLGSVQGTRVGSDGYVYPTDTLQPHGIRLGGGLGKKIGAFGFGAALSGVFDKDFGLDQNALVWGLGLSCRPKIGPLTAGLYLQGASGDAASANHKITVQPGITTRFGDAQKSSYLGTLEGSFGGDHTDASLKIGAEYSYMSKYFVRCGYHFYNDNAQLDGFRGLTAGLGWRSNRVEFDYALTTLGSLGMGHQFSFRLTYPDTAPVSSKQSKGIQKHSHSAAQKSGASSSAVSTAPDNKSEKAPEASDSGMMEWYKKGMEANESKDYAQAIKYLKKAVALKDPAIKDYFYAEAYATLGSIYQNHRIADEHLDQARKYYLKALAIDPDTETAKKGLKQLNKDENEP